MKERIGIVGYGAYVPRTRVKREEFASTWGITVSPGERAVCSYDEDVVTMAVEASLKALETVKKHGITPRNVGAIFSAYSDTKSMNGLLNVILAKTVGVSSDTHLFDMGHSHNAGASSWLTGIDAISSGRVSHALTVMSSNEAAAPGSELEPYIGAGATAFILGKENIMSTIEEAYSYSGFFVDYVTSDNVVQVYQQNFVEDQGYATFVSRSVNGLLEKTGKSIADFGHVMIQAPNERALSRIAKKLGCKENQLSGRDILQSIGYLGMNSIFMVLAKLLPSLPPGEEVLMVSYGSGASTAFQMKMTSNVSGNNRESDDFEKNKKYVDYLTYLRYQGLIEKEKELR